MIPDVWSTNIFRPPKILHRTPKVVVDALDPLLPIECNLRVFAPFLHIGVLRIERIKHCAFPHNHTDDLDYNRDHSHLRAACEAS